MCLRRQAGFQPPGQGRKYMFVMYGGSAKTDKKGEYLQYPYSILVKVDESDRKALEQDTRFFLATVVVFGRPENTWSEAR